MLPASVRKGWRGFMRTLCYCRTSSAIQADGNDTEAQRHAIAHWLKGARIPEESVEWFVDSGVSGSTMQRPEWERMLGSIKPGEPATVVIYDLSRAGRTLKGLLDWVEAMIAAKVRVVFVKDSLDINTATGRLMLQIMGAVAEWERQNTAERIRQGVRAQIAKGGGWGGSKLPVGSKGGPKLSPETLVSMRADDAAGMSRAAIARKYGLARDTVRKHLGPQAPVAEVNAASS